MRNLQFGFFDDSGLPRESRILMFYSFETEENLSRSGILHFHVLQLVVHVMGVFFFGFVAARLCWSLRCHQ